jgi:PhnB protein
MQLVSYLNFDGTCREAMTAYQGILGGEVSFVTPADTPTPEAFADDRGDRVMHARLEVGDAVLLASDTPPGQKVAPQGVYVMAHVDDVGDAERIFAALAEGGEVEMPIGETFWAKRYGSLRDRFGIGWMVNCE